MQDTQVHTEEGQSAIGMRGYIGVVGRRETGSGYSREVPVQLEGGEGKEDQVPFKRKCWMHPQKGTVANLKQQRRWREVSEGGGTSASARWDWDGCIEQVTTSSFAAVNFYQSVSAVLLIRWPAENILTVQE